MAVSERTGESVLPAGLDVIPALIAAMRPAGLTHDQAMACLKDQDKANAIVAIGKRATDEIKMTGTPTFVIDGKGVMRLQHVGPIYESDIPIILDALEKAR